MQTKLISIPKLGESTSLSINFATSAAGSIRVELLDKSGVPIPGFAAADCNEIIGDRIDRLVTWRGDSNLSSLGGRAVRLRFLMKDADLYSLQFK